MAGGGMEKRISDKIDGLQRQTVASRQIEMSDTREITLNRQEDVKNIDLRQMLGGVPASFVRMKSSQDGEVQFKKWGDSSWKQYYEGISANRVQKWRNENLEWIKVIPVTYPCTVLVYASGYKPAANVETGGTV